MIIIPYISNLCHQEVCRFYLLQSQPMIVLLSSTQTVVNLFTSNTHLIVQLLIMEIQGRVSRSPVECIRYLINLSGRGRLVSMDKYITRIARSPLRLPTRLLGDTITNSGTRTSSVKLMRIRLIMPMGHSIIFWKNSMFKRYPSLSLERTKTYRHHSSVQVKVKFMYIIIRKTILARIADKRCDVIQNYYFYSILKIS